MKKYWYRFKYAVMDFDLSEFLIEHVLRVKFIVNENREFGVRILWMNCYYYKRSSPLCYSKHDDGKKMEWREVSHREFSESISSPYNFLADSVHPDYGAEYKLNEQWGLIENYPVPKYIIEKLGRR